MQNKTAQQLHDLDAQKARHAQKFFIGQIVRLRCGGPLMMVEGPAPFEVMAADGSPTIPPTYEMGVFCCWFTAGNFSSGGSREMVGGQLCRERFDVALLINCDPHHGARFDGTALEVEAPRQDPRH